ncbi:MAG: hypothetical protein ACI82H_002364 [Alphaproteobacteria bacterium]
MDDAEHHFGFFFVRDVAWFIDHDVPPRVYLMGAFVGWAPLFPHFIYKNRRVVLKGMFCTLSIAPCAPSFGIG